jgi:acetate kinase
VDDAVLQRLETLIRLAPLHQPQNLAAIRAVRAARPDIPQVACFDTAFHRERASVVERYALPHPLLSSWSQALRLSRNLLRVHRPLAQDIAPDRGRARRGGPPRQRGHLCAMKDGRSVDTAMGFSVLDGLPMGTRCGILAGDAALSAAGAADPDAIEHLLYHESGLLGISGVSNDMRDLLAVPSRSRGRRSSTSCSGEPGLGALAAALGAWAPWSYRRHRENSPEIGRASAAKASGSR